MGRWIKKDEKFLILFEESMRNGAYDRRVLYAAFDKEGSRCDFPKMGSKNDEKLPIRVKKVWADGVYDRRVLYVAFYKEGIVGLMSTRRASKIYNLWHTAPGLNVAMMRLVP